MSSLLSVIFIWNTASSQQIFDTSNNKQYENIMLTCTQPNCEIICDTTLGCSNTIINASASETLSVSCLGNNSCTDMNIISSASLSTDISCEYFQSCSRATFNTVHSQNVTLTCNYDAASTDTQGACYQVELNADTSTNVNVHCDGSNNCYEINIQGANVAHMLDLNCNGYMACQFGDVYCPLNNACNIKCSGDAFSCGFMQIYIDNVDADVNIDCPGSSEFNCVNTKIYCGGISKTSESKLYHDSKSAWGCHMDGCCPTNMYATTMTCSTQQCEIDCVSNDCSRYIIDGTAAQSLTVNCSQSMGGGCGVTNILCPNNANAPCIVNCQGTKSCYQALVRATSSHSLELNCQGMKSCQTMSINCPSSETNVGCVVDCDGADACHYGSIAATDSYSLDVHCRGDRACFGLTPIYCPYDAIDVCNIDCSSGDQNICFGMQFWVNDEFVIDYMHLTCPATNINDACGNFLWVCIADGSTNKGAVLLTFDESTSMYRCDMDDNQQNMCCPWDSTSGTSQTMKPTADTINPTMTPSKPPTEGTANPTTRAPSQTTNSPTQQPASVTVYIVNSAVFSNVSVTNHVLLFVLLLAFIKL